jgi:hypothetical protein
MPQHEGENELQPLELEDLANHKIKIKILKK